VLGLGYLVRYPNYHLSSECDDPQNNASEEGAMKEYVVEVTETRAYCVRYTVEATSEESAKAVALDCNCVGSEPGELIEVLDRTDPEIIEIGE